MKHPAAVHANDPASSYRAEERVTKSGKRATDRQIVEQAVRDWPNSTAAELHLHLFGCMDLITVRRRLDDLRKMGLAKQGEQRKCRIAGTLALTWYPVTKVTTQHFAYDGEDRELRFTGAAAYSRASRGS